MTIRTALIGAPVIALLLGGCVQHQADPDISVEAAQPEAQSEPTSQVTLQPEISTIKPGASVTFSHDEVAPLNVGETGSVTLTVNEGYPSGVLTLEATGEPGLEVFGAQTTVLKDMSAGTTHSWQINYSAAADGLYYINVLAMAEPGAGLSSSRSYAVRVEVGEWEALEAASSKTTLSTGEPAVIMEAEETIE